VGSRGEAGDGPVTSAPGYGDERELVRAFTDLHQQDRFMPAARPVAPMRVRHRPAGDVINARTVKAPAAEARVAEAQVAEAQVAEAPASEPRVTDPQGAQAATLPDAAVDAPEERPAPRPDALPHRSVARHPRRRHHDMAPRPPAPDAADDVRRRGLAGTGERRLSDVLALAGASGALIAPWPWLLAVSGLCIVVGAVRSVAARRGSVTLGIVALPGRAARRVARLARPRSLARLPVIMVKTILAALVLPAAVAAAVWVVEHGADGVVAAARLAAWQSGLRVLAAVLCLMMLAGVGETRARRATRLRRATASWPDAGVVGLAAGALALAFSVVAVGPRVSGGILTGHDGLAWVPAPLRPAVDGVRDDVVTAELRTLRSCLSRHQGWAWSVGYSADNPIDDPDIARLSLGRGDAPGPSALVTAALAADNQLAPWIEVIQIAVGDSVVLALDRRELDHHGVRVDPATLGPGIVSGGDVLLSGSAAVDRRVALACSAGPAI
jgi:hypothetical protein